MKYEVTVRIKRVIRINASSEAEAEAARRRIYNANRAEHPDLGPDNTLDVSIEPLEKTS